MSEKFQSRFGWRPSTADSGDTGLGISDHTEGEKSECVQTLLCPFSCLLCNIAEFKTSSALSSQQRSLIEIVNHKMGFPGMEYIVTEMNRIAVYSSTVFQDGTVMEISIHIFLVMFDPEYLYWLEMGPFEWKLIFI